MCSRSSLESICRTSKRVAPKKRRNPKSSGRKTLKSKRNVKLKLLYAESKRKKQNYRRKNVRSYRESKMLRSRN